MNPVVKFLNTTPGRAVKLVVGAALTILSFTGKKSLPLTILGAALTYFGGANKCPGNLFCGLPFDGKEALKKAKKY